MRYKYEGSQFFGKKYFFKTITVPGTQAWSFEARTRPGTKKALNSLGISAYPINTLDR
jgi:hypothetical protein